MSQLPINMSPNSRKELHKMAVATRAGSRASGSGCISLSSTDGARKGSMCQQAKINTAQRCRGSGAAIAEQLNHHSHAASRKTVATRAQPGPVVSCRPPWYTAWAPSDSWPMVCQDFPSHLRGSPTCTEPWPFPLFPPREELNEGINDDQDVSGRLHRSSGL